MDNPLVQPDPGLFIWTILTFLVLLALLAKFAWRPLLKALEDRQDSIRKSLEEAQEAREEMARVQRESAQMLASARVEAEAIVSRSRSDADRLKVELKREARAEADAIVRRAEGQIHIETEQALRQIRHAAVDMAVMIASKLIQRNLTKEDNDRLIDEALKQIEARRD